MGVNRLAFAAGFLPAAYFAPLTFSLLLPLNAMIVLSAAPVIIGLVGFITRARWYDRGHGAVLHAVFGVGAGLVCWGTTRMAQELQEVTYYLKDHSSAGIGMAQYVAPEAGAVVPLFRSDLLVFLAALIIVAALEAAHKARSGVQAIQPST